MGRVVAALQQEGVLLLGVLMLLELVTKAGVSLLDYFFRRTSLDGEWHDLPSK